ncbi:hypothetical protein BU16DRAFT_212642 [Lophium mytilinum]|uniref:Uncharacterized protein n=1 Tax=Lophium mytilinum TaxID=390894 RepID=A0A6A6Q946_9PEZI|nr:hypothetical protein BU16DRAFT_212642 [Lophium mytilinum]
MRKWLRAAASYFCIFQPLTRESVGASSRPVASIMRASDIGTSFRFLDSRKTSSFVSGFLQDPGTHSINGSFSLSSLQPRSRATPCQR